MNYYFDDFTLEKYKELLIKAKEKYMFIPFTDAYKDGLHNIILWRHDVDLSVNQACILSEIERMTNVEATYFIHFHSEFYSVFERGTLKKIYEMIENGANIGLHFDFGFYQDMYGKEIGKEELEDLASSERNLLAKILLIKEKDIAPISFHNPELCNVLDIQDEYYGGMINAYSLKIKERFGYCSDSNGYWRYARLEDVLIGEGQYINLQVLTHPGWWQNVAMSPAERIQKILKDRKIAVYCNYCNLLEQGNRPNLT